MERKSWGRLSAEFGVIVLGVLTALVLESAWQGWQEARAEDQYLVELRNEAQQNLEKITLYVEESETLMLALEVALLRIESGDTAGSEVEILNTLVRAAWQSGILTGGVSRAVFDDLTNTGNMRLISNSAIRHSAANTYALYVSTAQRVIHGNERIDSGLLHLLAGQFFPMSVGIERAGEFWDLDALVSQPSFSVETRREHHRLRHFVGYLRQLQPAFRNLVSLLDSEIANLSMDGSA